MHHRLTSRKRPAADANKGKTVPAQGQSREPVPRLPHERDESADSQAAQQQSGERVGKQAHEDIERGLVDTDKGPVLDETYEKVRDGAGDPLKKLAP